MLTQRAVTEAEFSPCHRAKLSKKLQIRVDYINMSAYMKGKVEVQDEEDHCGGHCMSNVADDIDALLGCLRKKDIGSLYPSNKNKFKNIRSPNMLKPIILDLENNNCFINNLDINLICEKPKVSKYRNKIINSLSNLMYVDKNIINLKGKTVEKLGLIGKECAIACEAIVSISKYE